MAVSISLMGGAGGSFLVVIDGIPAKMTRPSIGGVRIYLLVGLRWSWGKSAYAGNAGA